jgi:hypothetical protein
VAYLGHIISIEGVAMDSAKITVVHEWPTPHSAHDLRGFLGLASYYKKLIKDFGVIVAPLTRLLRRDAFVWDDEATMAFQVLKEALTMGPVLQMSDFNKLFMVDCDGSGTGTALCSTRGGTPGVLQSVLRSPSSQARGLQA